MTAHEQVRIVLTHHRAKGTPFEAAWLSALRSLPRRSQLEDDVLALLWAKPHWRVAYFSTPVEEHTLASGERAGDAQTRETLDMSSALLGASDARARALAA